MTQDRLRLRVNPPNVAAPVGSRDVYLNADGDLLLESPDGSKDLISPARSQAAAGDTTLGTVPRGVLVDDDAAGGQVTVTLPNPAPDLRFEIKKLGSTADVVIVGTIDGAANLILKYQNSAVTLYSNGVSYSIL